MGTLNIWALSHRCLNSVQRRTIWRMSHEAAINNSLEPNGHEDEKEMDEDKYVDHDDEGDDENEDEDGGQPLASKYEEHVQVRLKKLMEVESAKEVDVERELRVFMQENLDSRK
jgi:hypothetical protein